MNAILAIIHTVWWAYLLGLTLLFYHMSMYGGFYMALFAVPMSILFTIITIKVSLSLYRAVRGGFRY